MSYMVLARKCRPKTWNDVVGQAHVTNTLQNAIRFNRLAHSYLFTGSRGVGKTSVARILAKTLNCLNPVDGSPCEECGNCKEIISGSSVDVFEIDGASNRGIDDIRGLRENIKYPPTSGKYRIYIIDEVHMLTTQAFNALLKTLEEPPDHALFIFATTEPHKVPATILSRCQRFDFKRVAAKEIAARLKQISIDENVAIDDEALSLIARKADGSLRDSQSIFDQLISFAADRITVKEVIAGLGLIETAFFFEVTELILKKDMKAGMGMVERVISSGYDIEEFLSGMTEHLRNCLIVKTTGVVDLLDCNEEEKIKFTQISSQFIEGDLLRLIQIVNDARVSLKNATNARLPFELAIIKMIQLDKTVTIDHLLEQFGALAKGTKTLKARPIVPIIESQQQPAPPVIPSAPVVLAESKQQYQSDCRSGEIPKVITTPDETVAEVVNHQVLPKPHPQNQSGFSLEKIQKEWPSVIDKVKHRKITVGSFLQEGAVLAIQGNCIELGFSMQNGFHIDAIKMSKSLVEEVLCDIFGKPLTFTCKKKDIPQREFITSSRKEKQAQLNDMQSSDPAVKKIIDDFDAEIVD